MTLGIVTISFNQVRYLSEAIESVRVNDESKLRYVIVDPGSNDGSRELIQSQKGRFDTIIMEPDKGPADGLNKGFAACDADVYGYLNSDDRFAPGALNWVLEFFEENQDVDVLLGAAKIIDENGKPRLRKTLSWSFTPESILAGTATAIQQATFFRRRVLNKFNIENHTCWDFEQLIDMLLAGASFKICHKVLGEFRIHSASISGSGRLQKPYVIDMARLKRKIVAAGVKEKHPALSTLQRLLHKFNPARRALEVFVS